MNITGVCVVFVTEWLSDECSELPRGADSISLSVLMRLREVKPLENYEKISRNLVRGCCFVIYARMERPLNFVTRHMKPAGATKLSSQMYSSQAQPSAHVTQRIRLHIGERTIL